MVDTEANLLPFAKRGIWKLAREATNSKATLPVKIIFLKVVTAYDTPKSRTPVGSPNLFKPFI